MDGKCRGLTAGIIIIGDEILKGHVQDVNSHYLCHQLWLLGVKVCKTVVVADNMESIVEEVRRFAPAYDFVLTTGGVGPTHDDVTLEAVGKAFGEECLPHPDILKALFGDEKKDDSSSPWRKLAIVPKSTRVYLRMSPSNTLSCFLMAVHNVHCYPGVPSLAKNTFQNNKDLYSRGTTRFFLKEIFFSCDEDVLARPLSQVQREYPSVQVGSYPDSNPSHRYLVKVTLESDNKDLVEKAYTRVVLSLPTAVMMSATSNYDGEDDTASSTSLSLRQSLSWFFQSLTGSKSSLVPTHLCQKIYDSIQIMEKALQQYSLDELCVAFNGGKDCTVMLYLLHSILKRRGESKLKALYVMNNDPFPEVEEFVRESTTRYDLEVIRIPGTIQEALSVLKRNHSEVKAIFMGTRHTDPYSKDLEAFAPTDTEKGWPKYMRINCVLDWSYSEVWLFLKLFEIKYCKLYDQGYTSLDGRIDTHPNPALLLAPCSGRTVTDCDNSTETEGSYLPAYLLSDEGLERAGRMCRT